MEATSHQFYCPSCGHPITDAHPCPVVGKLNSYTMLTCWQPECPLVGATFTDLGLLDETWLKAWHVARRFDLTTGEKLK